MSKAGVELIDQRALVGHDLSRDGPQNGANISGLQIDALVMAET